MGLICATTIPNRRILMPAINQASDNDDKNTWGKLHGLSILVTLTHIGLAGTALSYLS